MTVLPKVGNDIFNKEIWTEANRLVQAIAKIQVSIYPGLSVKHETLDN